MNQPTENQSTIDPGSPLMAAIQRIRFGLSGRCAHCKSVLHPRRFNFVAVSHPNGLDGVLFCSSICEIQFIAGEVNKWTRAQVAVQKHRN